LALVSHQMLPNRTLFEAICILIIRSRSLMLLATSERWEHSSYIEKGRSRVEVPRRCWLGIDGDFSNSGVLKIWQYR
jgi:hypothetical protein